MALSSILGGLKGGCAGGLGKLLGGGGGCRKGGGCGGFIKELIEKLLGGACSGGGCSSGGCSGRTSCSKGAACTANRSLSRIQDIL